MLMKKGNPVERTKDKYPYSYDPFVVWKTEEDVKQNNTVYSDRLKQWDYEKYSGLCQKHFGNQGDN